jgi:tetratricopeptide (TPR) repeat protein
MSKARLAKGKKAHVRQRGKSAKPNLSHLLPPELLQDKEDDAENLLGLERMLTFAQGAAIAFVRVNIPSRRAELAKEIRERVESQGIKIVEIDLHEPVRDLLAEIRHRLKNTYLIKPRDEKREFVVADSPPRFAIFVYGLEHSIHSSETYQPALAVMNYKRENFRDLIPAPIVLWVPEYALQAIMEDAPDFWAWRSGVFEFDTPKIQLEKSWVEVKPESGKLELSRMTVDEKRQRIQLLSGLLAEYETRNDSNSPEIIITRLDLYDRIGKLYYLLGDYERALEFHEREHNIAKDSDNKFCIANSLHGLGMINQARGNYSVAIDDYTKASEIFEEIGNPTGLAIYLHQIGSIYQERGEYELALEMYEKSIRIKEKFSDVQGIANSLHGIGNIHYLRQDYGAALSMYSKAFKISEEIGDSDGVASSLHHMAMVNHVRGEYIEAQSNYEKALKISEAIGDRTGAAMTLNNIGAIYQARGDYSRAMSMYEKALQISKETGSRAGVALTRGQIGILFTQTMRYSEAFENLLFTLKTFTELQSPNAKVATDELRKLRNTWGESNFDAAWQQATGKPVPVFLIEESSN